MLSHCLFAVRMRSLRLSTTLHGLPKRLHLPGHSLRAALSAAALAATAVTPTWAQTTYDGVGTYVYTVPANAIAINVRVVGGEGGDGGSGGSSGGQGALGQVVSGRIAVTPGESVNVLVGRGGDGGVSGTAQVSRGTGGLGGQGVSPVSNGLATGGAGGVGQGGVNDASGGGRGGAIDGWNGENGSASGLDGNIIHNAAAGGGGGRGGGGGGGGMGGDSATGMGGGGGGGAGSSHVSIGGTRLRAGGGGGGGGGYSATSPAVAVPGANAVQPDQDMFTDLVTACTTSGGGMMGDGGLAISLANNLGGGGGGGGGGGYHGGAGGNSGSGLPGNLRTAAAGGGGEGCSSSAIPNALSNFSLLVGGGGDQGILPLGRPAGSGRDGKVVITPLFAYPITVVASPPEGGSGNCDPNPVNEGEISSCTATPNAGWRLTGISGCGGAASATSPYETGAIADTCTVTATFEQIPQYPITEVASPPEGGQVVCNPNPVNESETSTCTATPNAGWQLTGISGCGGAPATTSPYITGVIAAACTVTATFQADTTPGGNTVRAVPAMSQWGLLLLGLLATTLGLYQMQRVRRNNG